MLRRPINQLVAQGIMPPLKTPPAFHDQRRQLERAKTGDMLKAKIQQRPARHELERRHILEADPAHVDPSLAERQRMLKKARLADQLNDQLSHRPGPLELIQKNILHTEEPIEEAVKAGRIPFRATCEGQLTKPQHPNSYVNLEDDSQSSEGDSALVSPGPSDVLETAAKSAGIVVSLAIPAPEGTVVVTTATPVYKDSSDAGIVFADLCRSVAAPLLPLASVSSPASLVSSTSTLSPLSSVASPVPSIVSQPATPAPPPPPPPVALTPRPLPSPARTDAPGKDKNRKKSKSKSTPKTRTIKFHEYKGPPNAQKNAATPAGAAGETSYELLLHQQQLFLQWQVQLQHKYPQIILPATQKPPSENIVTINTPLPSPATSTTSETSIGPTRILGRLEDMKVNDLKAELKRRNLPVSGSKPQLIDRLKSFAGSVDIINHNSILISKDSQSSIASTNEDSQASPPQQDDHGSPLSIDEEHEQMDLGESCSPTAQQTNEDIVREQQRQIEELQRELTLSQLKLQQAAAVSRAEPKPQRAALQQHLQAKRQQQLALQNMQQLQALQARQTQVNQEQQRIQQQQHVAFQNSKNLAGGLLLNETGAAIVLNHLVQGGKAKLINGHSRANSLPNFLNATIPIIRATLPTPEIKTETVEDIKPPPPLYEEATKHIKKEKNNVKSQIVDDVLEILIKNGELPPSAAHDPSTPGSAGTKICEPVFPTAMQAPNSPEGALGLDLLDTLEPLENMDFSQLMELGNAHENSQTADYENTSVPMDTDDTDWLESLLPTETNGVPLTSLSHESELGAYDPLLANNLDPFDPFCLEEFRSTDLMTPLSWDKIDFAA